MGAGAMDDLYMGVDVGTESARAGVFDAEGTLLGAAACGFPVYREPPAFVEQSAEAIWQAVASACRKAVAESGVEPGRVQGIGFDATCSLVVVDAEGSPLPVGPSEDPDRNIIVWMDHRAVAQAERINLTGHAVLDYVGGRISPEMQTPKLLWLKEHRPAVFQQAAHFFDLTDYLTWRASGSIARSTCTVTCKWTYLAHEDRWDGGYFRDIGLGELADEGFRRIGTGIVDPGTPLGDGLTDAAAMDLGLTPGIAVGAGLIDAHAGGIGTVGSAGDAAPSRHMAYVFGTSSCTMTTTAEPVFVPGIWGPYYSAMVPGQWLNEGGQSAAGAAIDQLLRFHPASAEAQAEAAAAGQSLPAWLAAKAEAREEPGERPARLAEGLHVVPEFLGNRAPHADPYTRAVIAGLGMATDTESLVRLYIAGVCGLGYGLRQIIEAQADAGARIETIVISGGAGRSTLVRQLIADATGHPVTVPSTPEPVLLGSAILGAVAAGAQPTLTDAMARMSSLQARHDPDQGAIGEWHSRRYALYGRLQQIAREAAAETRQPMEDGLDK